MAGQGFRYVLLCFVAAASLPLAGCWNRTEVNDLALVTGAAIDLAEGKMIELSVQVFIPRTGGGQQAMGGGGGGGGGGAGGGAQTLVRSGRGATIAEAMSKLQEKFPRKLFWGHTDVFIIGESLAKQGIRDQVDFLMRFPQTRERAAMFVSEGEAKKTLGFHPPLERSSAEVLREMSKSRLSMDVDLKKLAQMLSGGAGAAALPWVEMLPPEKGQMTKQSIPYVYGVGVFKKDRLVGQLDDIMTRGVLWVRDEIVKETVITITPQGTEGYVSFNLESSTTNVVPEIRDNKWSVTINIETNENLIQNATRLDVMSMKVNDSLERQLEEEIRHRVEEACSHAKEMGTDIFDFADDFHRKYPKQWNSVKAHWEDKFASLEINVATRVKIRRPGSTTSTGANRPQDEVEKP
ncbi:spore gernimation protein GerC [Gordoniibacillus kamchatkensis]|uniref:Spore gernimation protein GerC n=1 Tax=Gordoniibacillus kamchatkensis TaxID=1590651 RepID=A0ABR5AIF6_9BACL|nr:spore gernimation protein GerC [Paenibacillus sp. VKM B-2647]